MRFSSNRVTIRMYGPNNFSLEEMDKIASDLEVYVNERRDRYKIKNVMTYFRRGYINLRMNLEEDPHQEWWYAVYRWAGALTGFPIERWDDAARDH